MRIFIRGPEWPARTLPLVAALLLAGCYDHNSGASAAAGTQAPLALTGTPATDVVTNSRYFFQPAVLASSGAVSYGISGKPDWLSFDASTGALSGTAVDSSVGTSQDIVITASTLMASARIGPFRIRVRRPTTTPTTSANIAPTISGNPITTVQAGAVYSFTPTASDANGDVLSFQIQNKPAWASFTTSTGQIYGSPLNADSGSYTNITISVSDGKASATLGAFTIVVNKVAAPPGSASLSWTPPTQNTDGTALTDLAGYRVYYGNDPAVLSNSIVLNGAANNSYVVTNLAAGTWYFSVRAYNSAGVESDSSATASKTIV
jgi:hypothetical protein